jgi:hypothetical protein
MPKSYIKEIIPGGKRYRALLRRKKSRCSFKTATQAEEYAVAWMIRYQRLEKAAAEFREFQAELARYQMEEGRLDDAAEEESYYDGFVDPATQAELDYEDELTLSDPDTDCNEEIG